MNFFRYLQSVLKNKNLSIIINILVIILLLLMVYKTIVGIGELKELMKYKP
jgi:hypothetical protein